MDQNIDTTRRKPRQARGTPAFRVAHLFSFGVLTLAAGFVMILHSTRTRENLTEYIKEAFKESEESINHRKFIQMSFLERSRPEKMKAFREQMETLGEIGVHERSK